MSNNFLYDAPTFFDFVTHPDAENTAKVESYFDVDHERNKRAINYEHEVEIKERIVEQIEENPSNRTDTSREQTQQQVIKSGHEVEITGGFVEENTLTESQDEIQQDTRRMPRRSLSTGNLFRVNGQSVIATDKSDVAEKIHSSTRLYRSSSRNNMHNLARPKVINTHAMKFVSMAEAINRFYNKTPERFHTKTKDPLIIAKRNCNVSTIPHSPCLMTKQRARMTQVLSQKELEDKEVEEARKFKIKAHPLNPKVFQGPVKPIVIKKSNTVIEPFNLTESTAKMSVKSPETFEFHAKPVPKYIYTTPKAIPKMKKHSFVAAPRLSQHNDADEAKKRQAAEKHQAVKVFVPVSTQLAPFSFEGRDKEMMRKKEELFNKVLDEEKKAREFHARPPPKYLNSKRHNGSMMSIRSNKSEEDVTSVAPVFKARPATVLYKKPFEPKRGDHTLVEITEFELNTERRAKDRQEFENEMKKKEEKLAELRKQADKRREELEKQERSELRKKAEHRANPIRHYKEMKIVPPQKITVPLSPALRTAGLKNKENAQ